MALNPQNLQPVKTKEEARERGRAGGIASGKAKRERKTMRQLALELGDVAIDLQLPGGKKKKSTMAAAVVMGQYQSAIKKGNTKAAYFLAQLRGELEEKISLKSDQPLIVVKTAEEKEKLENLGDLNV